MQVRSAFLAMALLVAHPLSARAADGTPITSCSEPTTGTWLRFILSGQSECYLPFAPGVVTLRVEAFTVPIQKIRLALPDPPMGTVISETWGVSHTGDRATGMEVDLGGCQSGSVPWSVVQIGELQISVSPEDVIPCEPWTFAAGSEALDCEGYWRPASPPVETYYVGEYSVECDCSLNSCAAGIPPYDHDPPDGTTNVPLDATLSWTTSGDYDNGYPGPGCWVEIGTEPNCENGEHFQITCDADSFQPDFLQPSTTYYWQAGWHVPPTGCDYGIFAVGPVHSFTTAPPIQTQNFTVGRVKAIYR